MAALFDLLCSMDGYDPAGAEVRSRPADSLYVYNRFANGAVTVANHYRTFYEHWNSLFFRDNGDDTAVLEGRTLPPVEIALDETLFGHRIQYRGLDTLTYRLDAQGTPVGYAGNLDCALTVDGKTYRFAGMPGRVVWSVLDRDALAPGIRAAMILRYAQAGMVTLPNTLGTDALRAGVCGEEMFAVERALPVRAADGYLEIELGEAERNRWVLIYA